MIPITATITLPATMDIAACGVVQSMLLEQLPNAGQLRIEAYTVERVSTPGVQLLLAAIKHTQADGKQLVVVSPSPMLVQAIADLGLERQFEPHIENGEANP